MAFRRLLEKATDQALLEPDLNLNLQVVDSIRQQDATAKQAMVEIRRRMLHKNANISYKTLVLLEMVVKNCGAPVQAEVATAQMMSDMRKLIQHAEYEPRRKALELIQTWAHAFAREPAYKIVSDTFNDLRMRQHQFPEFNPEGDAMFVAERAPSWVEGDCCHRCRDKFTVLLRRHHCRACGQIFCQKCSSKNSRIPKFGIEKEVRVCDRCYDQLRGKSTDASDAAMAAALATELSPEEEVARAIASNPQLQAVQPAAPSSRDLEQREREEMELALALSLSEAESSKGTSSSAPSSHATNASYPSYAQTAGRPMLYEDYSSDEEDEVDAMQQYLHRHTSSSSQSMAPTPSAPMAEAPMAGRPQSQQQPQQAQQQQQQLPQQQLPQQQLASPSAPLSRDTELVESVHSQLTLLEQKIRRAAAGTVDLNRDRAVQTIVANLSKASVALVAQMDAIDDERHRCVVLQEKHTQINDMLERLRELKRENDARLEQQRQEQELLARIQLEQKMKLLEQQAKEKQEAEQRMRAQQAERARQQQEAQAQMAAEQEKREQLFMQQALLERQQAMAAVHSGMRMSPPTSSFASYPGQMPPAHSMPPHHPSSSPYQGSLPPHSYPQSPQSHAGMPPQSQPSPLPMPIGRQHAQQHHMQQQQQQQQQQQPIPQQPLPLHHPQQPPQPGMVPAHASLAPPAHNMPSSHPEHKVTPTSSVQSDLGSLFGAPPAASAAPPHQQFHSPMQQHYQQPQSQPHQPHQPPQPQQQQQFQPPPASMHMYSQPPPAASYGGMPPAASYGGAFPHQQPPMQSAPPPQQHPPHQQPIEANLISFD